MLPSGIGKGPPKTRDSQTANGVTLNIKIVFILYLAWI
jgi:hypothetical protein